ncbi:hypothetical protein PORY_002633 [Pneumocystis oryctolagi]|uniref:Uncharacterized protein n=1 Tax=Pneumocystis oryctolagi TaxID=42067 RepID=A0ACB7C967_9ASCO|nr:hypothetical protein PORY_002633 [Pneumocystis oryctolagi]
MDYSPQSTGNNWNVRSSRTMHRPLPPTPCHLGIQYQESYEDSFFNNQRSPYNQTYYSFQNENISFPRRRIVSHGDYSEDESVYQTRQENVEYYDNYSSPKSFQNACVDMCRSYNDMQDYASLDYKRKSYMNCPEETDYNCYYDSRENEHIDGHMQYGSEGTSKNSFNTYKNVEKHDSGNSLDALWNPGITEPDDYLHNPTSKDRKKDYYFFTKRGIFNIGSLIFLVLGIMFVFIGYPIMLYIRKAYENSHSCPDCIRSLPVDLLDATRGLIDPDTPLEFYEKRSKDGKIYKLTFSDEFNKNGRTFYPGDDQFWEAVDLHYWSTMSIEWYDPDAITTNGGFLEIRLDAFRNHNLNYRSGMLQSWNKLCFKGGIIEASISLPGRGDISGFWPAFWTLGNLARPGFGASTDGVWPYSYDTCDAGIMPNQSDPSGLSFLPGMRFPSCSCPNSDHPSPGKGRGAPEIDIIEASVDLKFRLGEASQSVQFAPFDESHTPDYSHMKIFDTGKTHINNYRGNPFQQTFSCITYLNNEWYNGNKFQTYSFEYEPGKNGFIQWYIGDQPTWMMKGESVGPNGKIGQRLISEEPMAFVINLAMSESFAEIEWGRLQFPAIMKIDWIRIYQETPMITCDPPGYPTTKYIKEHPIAYRNNNITTWENTGYQWPKNRLMHEC